MKNNNKVTLFLFVGALVSGIAGWFLTQDYINTEVREYQDSFDQERQAVPVIVAARDLRIGDMINSNTAQIRNVPAAYVHSTAVSPGAFARKLDGRPIIHAVRAGEPILPMHVTSVKIEGLSNILKKGERAVTIPTDTLNSLSGFLNPGDFVDLYITLKDGKMDRTVPLVENVRVLATGQDIDDGIKERHQKGYKEITLGVSPLHATKILHAQTVGNISILLRNGEDIESIFENYVTINNLIDIPQEAIQEAEAPKKWGFELIKGGTRF